jgi:hypothetical protein
VFSVVFCISIAFAVYGLLSAAPASADEPIIPDIACLRGLKGFWVTYSVSWDRSQVPSETALAEIEQENSRLMTQTVELELRKAGVKVCNSDEYSHDLAIANLDLSEVMILDEYGTMTTAILLSVRQVARVAFNAVIVSASIWHRFKLVILGREAATRTQGTAEYVRRMIADLLNDYLTANPKQ